MPASAPGEAPGGDGLQRASLLVALSLALVQLAALVVFFLLSRRLSLEEFGAYRQVTILRGVAVAAAHMGLPEALLFHLGQARLPEERRQTCLGAALWLRAAVPVVGLLCGLMAYGTGLATGSAALMDAAPWAALLGAVELAGSLVMPLLVTAGRAGRLLRVCLVQAGALLLLTYAATSHEPTLQVALAAAATVGAALTVYAMLLLRREQRGADGGASWSTRVMPLLRYGAPLALGNLLFALGYQSDHLAASLMFGPAVYAVYAAGAWQLPIGGLLQQAHRAVLVPTMAARHRAGESAAFWQEWHGLVRLPALAGSALVWLMFLAAEDLVSCLLGARFTQAVAVFQVYAWMLPLQMAAFNAPLRAAGHTRPEVVSGVVFIVVALGVAAAVTPAVGLAGPALGVLLGAAARATILVSATGRILGPAAGGMLPLRSAAIMLAGAGAVAVPCWAASRMVVAHPGLARLLLFTGLYGLAALVLWAVGSRAAPRKS